MVGRDEIAEVLRQLNALEITRPKQSVEETIAAIDTVMADDVEGWTNGVHTPNRDAERQQNESSSASWLTTTGRSIVSSSSPPANVAWTITGTATGKASRRGDAPT